MEKYLKVFARYWSLCFLTSRYTHQIYINIQSVSGNKNFMLQIGVLLMKSPKEVVKWNSTLFIILLKCVSSRTLFSCTHFKTSIFLLITVVTFTTSFGHCIRVVLFNFFGLPVGKKRLLFPFGSLFMKICSNAA